MKGLDIVAYIVKYRLIFNEHNFRITHTRGAPIANN